MKIIELSYSEGKTRQEVQFEPRSYHFLSAKAEVDSDIESVEVAYTVLQDKVRAALKKAMSGEIKSSADVPF